MTTLQIAITKRAIAERLYVDKDGDNKLVAPRKSLIAAFMETAKLSAAGAATYVANFRSQHWKINHDLRKQEIEALRKVGRNPYTAAVIDDQQVQACANDQAPEDAVQQEQMLSEVVSENKATDDGLEEMSIKDLIAKYNEMTGHQITRVRDKATILAKIRSHK